MVFATGRGFSVIELIAALAIVGLLSVIALPGWNRLQLSFRLSSSTRLVHSELQSLRIRSAAENASFRLAYAAGATNIEIQRDGETWAIKPGEPRARTACDCRAAKVLANRWLSAPPDGFAPARPPAAATVESYATIHTKPIMAAGIYLQRNPSGDGHYGHRRAWFRRDHGQRHSRQLRQQQLHCRR